MPQGLQIWKADGTLMLDTSLSVLMELGTTTIGGSTVQTGSLTETNFTLGNPFAVVMSVEMSLTNQSITYAPILTISGTTLSWNFPEIFAGEGQTPLTRIMWGLKT